MPQPSLSEGMADMKFNSFAVMDRLDQVPEITIQVCKHGHCSIRFLRGLSYYAHAIVQQLLIVARKIIRM